MVPRGGGGPLKLLCGRWWAGIYSLRVGARWWWRGRGAERIRRFVVPRVNATLAGKIDVRHLALRGDRIVLDEVTLRDPKGDLVAQVARVDVAFSPLALLRRRLSLRAVTLDRPSLLLRRDRTADDLSAAGGPGPPGRRVRRGELETTGIGTSVS